ncbi:MAG: 50S ribosomal protein L11 [Methanobacterium sp.]|jgi:large subunit ribosomal protein L11|uniref:Large ribosomal subunit protein uL11 n=1 Tax=Methanobacterium subterraneum TaxID=59277 RepID=A0A2H4V9G9_9EURY|nr:MULTISPECIES: 50S ribosomal protein L11 [Methanobacterium]AUB54745.1 50S ribosomal protein L11 [Methanobacterium subterraneum]MCC7559079.1 50S ribosomal protein L11 [Methanobacterium sp.]PKL72798.1 MAG: 50S ribosomal protein L11 [Methanobacteriales archaeon HGW-Methanobacteriales-2]HII83881.1 50S ribosomal protein L11 [Methanobacterium subterraneum]
MATETVEILIDGGKATPGPPLGPAIGPLGINMMQVVEQINQKTADFEGMKVPVKIIVDTSTKEFEVTVGTPPTTALIMDELKIEKGSQDPGMDKVADLKIEQALKVARMKFDALLSADYKHATKEVVGTCVSMGITVEGKDPREVQKEISQGIYDEQLVEKT